MKKVKSDNLETFAVIKCTKKFNQLINLTKQGNLAAKEKLLLANQRLIYFLLKRHNTLGVNLEDLVAEANLGLIKAIKKFNPKLGYKFSTYASWWIKDSIQTAINNYAGKPIKINSKSINEPAAVYRPKQVELNEQNLPANKVSPLVTAKNKKRQELIQSLCRYLTAKEKLILVNEFNLDGRLHRTKTELCQYLNISYPRYMKDREQLLYKLKCMLGARGINSLDDI